MIEFDPVAAPTESTIIRYFEKGLKSFIKDHNAFHLDNYKELVAKAVKAKTKAGLRPSFYIQKTDQQVLQWHWPVHTTTHKIQIQEAIKDLCGDDSKAKMSTSTQEMTTQRTNDTEGFEKA